MDKFLSKLSSGQKKVFYVFVVAVVGLLFYLLYVKPITKKIAEIENKIKLQETQVRNDLSYLANREQIIKERESYAQYIPKELGNKDDIESGIYKALEQLTSESNLNLEKSQLGETSIDETHFRYHANLSCSGELNDMISFMHLLNTSDDLFKITGFTMSPKRGAENEVTTSITVEKLVVKPDA
ncbi:MAG: hypothetical protein AB7S78_13965 [Candidatus Omnitrophota bacterium]